MTSPVLLTKLSKFNNTDFELFNMYCNATSKSFETVADEFNTCIDNIKYLTEKQYDFSWITENAKTFEVNRGDFKNVRYPDVFKRRVLHFSRLSNCSAKITLLAN